jgi:hypothetical protein
MAKSIFQFVLSFAFISCSDKPEKVNYQMIEVIDDNSTPTVEIKKYRLIANEDRKKDATQIIALKRDWPLVMQSPGRIGFDTLLSQNFTFSGDKQLLNREEYITNRIKPSDWKITHVKYDNLTLQLFGNTALLTYKNEVTNENINTKAIETEYISWADIYVLENGKWKIGASHTIDFRLEN